MLRFTYQIYRYILPYVNRELDKWQERAKQIPDPELRKQALASIEHKRFHCEGGGIYTIPALAQRSTLIPLITAYQTISDYLDNLCDRSMSMDPLDFRQLHLSMLDAVTPGTLPREYYLYRPNQDDGGYLRDLVLTCQRMVEKLPGYGAVQERVFQLATWYGDLQVYKHITPSQREQRLQEWWEAHRPSFPEINWNEFAAATGSTLGVFALFQLATRPQIDADEIETLEKAYFPWICGLHILLDYLVDLEEDRMGGDLNFITYFSCDEEAGERLFLFAAKAREAAGLLPNSSFHRRIVDGLLGLYLADGKVNRQPDVARISRNLLRKGSWSTRFFYLNSLLYRGKGQVEQLPRGSSPLS